MNHTLLIILQTGGGLIGFLWRSLLLTSLVISLPGRAQAGVGETWEWRNPLPQGSGIKALVESNGRLIATGRAGTILTTTEGMNWTPRVSGTRNHLRAVAASGTTVVAVGREGDIVTSTDGGLTWALRSSGAVEWHTVVQGGGDWVAGGMRIVGGWKLVPS